MSHIREELANLAHQQWSGWMRYLFGTGTFNDDGTWRMPSWAVRRWKAQMETPYSELTEKEQDSDREEADKVLAIIGNKNVCTICGTEMVRAHIEIVDGWIQVWLCECE